jgi:hypothetical protein
MALDHRLPAIFTALFSSIGVLLAAVSGASCNFLLRINTEDEELLGMSGSFGVLCEHEIFPRDGDKFWELSRIFLIAGLTVGSLTAALAWSVASFLTPTGTNWNGISVLAALTAVVQVPIFVLFEAKPCMGDEDNEEYFSDSSGGLGCKLGPGSYLLIASDLFFIAVTVITQCLDRPRWGLDMDLWKVHKRGASRNGRRSQQQRNDEYYYDDNENYDDAVHLTSPRATSLNGSDGDGLTDFYKISRILPAGEAKDDLEKSKGRRPEKPVGFFARLFKSRAYDQEVPQGETQSMSAEEEYDYENQLIHDLEIVRVLPQATASTSSKAKSEEGREVSIGSFERKTAAAAANTNSEQETVNRSFQSFDAVIDEPTAKLQPWIPPADAANNNGTNNNTNGDFVEQHQMIDSPSASLIGMPPRPVVSDVNEILEDLHTEEMVSSSPFNNRPAADVAAASPLLSQSPAFRTNFELPQQQKPPPPEVATAASPDTDTAIVQENIKKHQGLKSSLRNMFGVKKAGYAQMSSDQSSDDDFTSNDTEEEDSGEFFNYYSEDNQPPPGLQLLNTQEIFHDETANAGVNESSLTGDGLLEEEVQHIYDDLNEKDSLLQTTDESEKEEDHRFPAFDTISIGSTHSDPGPLSFDASFGESTNFTPLFTSEGEQSSTNQQPIFKAVFPPAGEQFDAGDLFQVSGDESAWDKGVQPPQPEPNMAWDSDFSTLTSQATDDSSQEHHRGRQTARVDPKSRKRPVSPVESIKSYTSLLHMTIDEETDEDIKNELDPYTSFSLKRTLSSPELRAVVRPISHRRDKSTQELLKKLEKMKRAMRTEFDSNNSGGELPPRSPGGLPPRSPTKDSARPESPEEPAIPHFETSVIDPQVDDSSEVLSELLRSDVPDAKTAEPADPSLELQVDSPPSSVEDDSALPRTAALQEPGPSPNTRDAAANYATIPAKLETSNNEAWKDIISPMKDTPSKEWSRLASRIQATPKKDFTLDISDETSETGRTRSTISYDSDDSSSGGRGSSHKHVRSRSVGRGRRYGRTKAAFRSSNSHSPTSRRKPFAEGTSSCQLFDRARESRIRRLQQLRKGYMPLENDRAESPEPRYRSRDRYDDPLSDPELTPKRKTANVIETTDKLLGTEKSPSAIPETLYQPSLLESDDNEPCPEFDNILDDLDLQLIDLNRPIGAEYGAEEGSM